MNINKPSFHENLRSSRKRNTNRLKRNMTDQFGQNVFGFTGMGRIRDVMASTSRMFDIFDPITLYTARSVCPLTAPVRLTSNSGADVPMATIVRPITKGERLKRRATETLLLMRILPLKTNSAKPINRRRYTIGSLGRV